jgi:hypothetical protein
MSHKPRVFVTQIPSRKDHDTKLWVPTVNIAPATAWGEIEILLPAGSQFYAAAEVTRIIKQRLNELNYQPEDYLLPMGSPTVMAVASAIIARRGNGCMNLLQWDNQMSSYHVYRLENLV